MKLLLVTVEIENSTKSYAQEERLANCNVSLFQKHSNVFSLPNPIAAAR